MKREFTNAYFKLFFTSLCFFFYFYIHIFHIANNTILLILSVGYELP